MKNKKIIDSWNRIEPGDAANGRMLNAILENNRSVHTSVETPQRTKTPGTRNRIWIRWGAVAAVFVLLLTVALTLPGIFGTSDAISDTGSAAEESNKTVSETGEKGESDTGGIIYIPGVVLTEDADIEPTMISLVVYKGGVYTDAGSYWGEEAQKIDALLGDRLGYATGSIDEWSKQDEYSKEFASTHAGEVYAVKGYDTSFRVCIRENAVLKTNGETILRIQFLDRLNDITISTGKDLFEDRLHLNGRVDSIRWLTHGDWNSANNNYRDASFDESVWDAFLDEVDRGKFVYTYSPDVYFDDNSSYCSFYDTQNQAHLFLTLVDGTTVELRLIEGGYVGYQALGWYFVKIPGEAFDAVYDACGGTHLTDR